MKASLFCLTLLLSSAARAMMTPATPESQGVATSNILAWVEAVSKGHDGGRAGALHGFVLVRHGRTIAEGRWAPFDPLVSPHLLYSHSKSLTATAVGFLADEGQLDLDERIVDIFSNEAPASVSANLAQLRVRDLLTMNAGKDADHLLRGGGDWVRQILAADYARAPGSGFKYDSDASYLLAAIVERRAGTGMTDYLKPRLFAPLGITSASSTVSPQGIACGGWGFRMTTRDMARFGAFLARRGNWNGRQLLSSDWIALMTARQTWSGEIAVGAEALEAGGDWRQGYGFQFWRCRHNAYRADGAFGQMTVVMPDQDMVLAFNAGTTEVASVLDATWEHLLKPAALGPLPENPAALASLSNRLAALAIPAWGDAAARDLPGFGKTFALEPNRRGFASVRFARAADGYRCTLVTPSGEQTFPVGAGAWARGTVALGTETYEALDMNNGSYAVAASGGPDGKGGFAMKAYLVDTPLSFRFFLSPTGELRGDFTGIFGCAFKEREVSE